MAEKLTASILAAVLTFGMMAPQTAMTAEAAAKSTLEKDVQKLVKKSKAKKEKTQKKKLKKLFQYVEKNYGYARAIGFKNSRGWEKTFTAEMIKNKKGSCYHFAALYAFLAKESGVQARICLGRTNGFNKARWQDHAWCEVKVGKKWYICDPNMDKFAANSKGKVFYEDGFLHEINVQKIKNDQSKFLRKGRANEENQNTDRSSSSGTWRYRKQHFTGSTFHADGRSSHGKTGTCKSEKQVLLL